MYNAGMPIDRDDLPGTIRRSPAKAQRTYAKTLESAESEYGPGERAQRTAMAALKHSFEKVGDRWVAKSSRGPSDPRSERSGAAARRGEGESFDGVDVYGNSKQELYERAQKLNVAGRSRMSKQELARAIARKQ